MPNVPVRREQLRHKMTAFRKWLVENGAEISNPTNPYELLRYRAYSAVSKRAITHVVYTKDNGLLTWTGTSLEHFRAYLYGWEIGDKHKPTEAATAPVPVSDQPESVARRRRRKLLTRDGDACWFCSSALGDDITIEHLVPQSRGGGNDLANLVLAHRQCNADAADLSVAEKVEMRTRLRARTPTLDARCG